MKQQCTVVAAANSLWRQCHCHVRSAADVGTAKSQVNLSFRLRCPFHCCINHCRIYIPAQLLAAVLACSIFAFVSGWGPLMPLASMKVLNLTYIESMWMWATGSPPKRFQHSGNESITDVLDDVRVAKEAANRGKGLQAGEV